MPRLHVDLPDDLYQELTSRGLAPSALLRKALRAEVHRQDLLAATDAYIAELLAEMGDPTREQRDRAEAAGPRAEAARGPASASVMN
jgi:hypothetical protein